MKAKNSKPVEVFMRAVSEAHKTLTEQDPVLHGVDIGIISHDCMDFKFKGTIRSGEICGAEEEKSEELEDSKRLVRLAAIRLAYETYAELERAATLNNQVEYCEAVGRLRDRVGTWLKSDHQGKL